MTIFLVICNKKTVAHLLGVLTECLSGVLTERLSRKRRAWKDKAFSSRRELLSNLGIGTLAVGHRYRTATQFAPAPTSTSAAAPAAADGDATIRSVFGTDNRPGA